MINARCHPVKDKAARLSYAEAFCWCQVCPRGQCRKDFRGMVIHHLIRPGRSDEWCNFLFLCAVAHDLCHGYKIRVKGVLLPCLTLGQQLWIKRQCGPWNPERLTELYRQNLPDLVEPPECCLSRKKW